MYCLTRSSRTTARLSPHLSNGGKNEDPKLLNISSARFMAAFPKLCRQSNGAWSQKTPLMWVDMPCVSDCLAERQTAAHTLLLKWKSVSYSQRPQTYMRLCLCS